MDLTTKDERSLLLYLETRAVDHGGRVADANINAEDLAIAERWNAQGYVNFGRVAWEDVTAGRVTGSAHWCLLSPEAFEDAHRLRRERAARMWANRTWRSTAEKREAEHAAA